MIDLAKIRTAILAAEDNNTDDEDVEIQEGPNSVPNEIDNAATSITGSFGVGLLGASIYSEATGGEWFVGNWRVVMPVIGTALTAYSFGRFSRGKEAKKQAESYEKILHQVETEQKEAEEKESEQEQVADNYWSAELEMIQNFNNYEMSPNLNSYSSTPISFKPKGYGAW
jgi:hypothetical protein|tara:strand:+ start:1330 stop:1839 length:510 start_codon:yes stop_codon:yes gene_type:complete